MYLAAKGCDRRHSSGGGEKGKHKELGWEAEQFIISTPNLGTGQTVFKPPSSDSLPGGAISVALLYRSENSCSEIGKGHTSRLLA